MAWLWCLVVLFSVHFYLNQLHVVTALGAEVIIKHIPPAMATFRTYNIKRTTTLYTKFFVPSSHILTLWTSKSAHFCSFFLLLFQATTFVIESSTPTAYPIL
jgi:hypothetical protein